ncbi:MAG: FKBP-type peptidyl-prolyl cis-trans isomerase [Phaeodactylibacter sp.]|nr:FKBP-type peptidyl-prolyl cis-trans isomerase [Phaeodactylibacter sp.]MCB9265540.1 FKBP-type peptidyl-prolyl cis-trans isomerase [Lewinellaceae bacterium]MCB9288499.1 FKBP-type peptidyl-prolyl cis-trans isomerase [Lewinellaceae bacterium]
MRIALILALLAVIALISCREEEGPSLTQHGYEYVNHTKLEGEKPQPGEYVYFQVQIRNGDSITHSTRAQGATPYLQIPSVDNPQRRPSPLEDVLREMVQGDSVTVFIRLDTIRAKPKGFENTDIMYYDVVLNEIKSVDAFQEETRREREEREKAAAAARARYGEVADFVRQTLKQYKEGKLDEQLKETDSGLKYIIHEEGNGREIDKGRNVSVQFFGVLVKNGKVYDTSFEQGEPLKFPVGEGRVIKGWDEGMSLLKDGAKASFFIPYQLAYGEKGSSPDIPPEAELALYVEVVKVD